LEFEAEVNFAIGLSLLIATILTSLLSVNRSFEAARLKAMSPGKTQTGGHTDPTLRGITRLPPRLRVIK